MWNISEWQFSSNDIIFLDKCSFTLSTVDCVWMQAVMQICQAEGRDHNYISYLFILIYYFSFIVICSDYEKLIWMLIYIGQGLSQRAVQESFGLPES